MGGFLERVLLTLTLFLYLLGIALSAVGTLRRIVKAHWGSAAVLALAASLHLAAVIHLGITREHFPLSNTAEFLLVLAWVVVSLYLLVWIRWKIHAAGLVLPPLAALMVAAAIGVIPGAQQPIPYGSQGWFIFHATVSTVALAALGVAFAMSVIYLVQDHALKAKWSIGVLQRLPSLEACDQVGHQAILWGFPLLTLGILTGVVWNFLAHDRFWAVRAKETFPLLAWLLFAGLLYARSVRGFRGRKSAYLTILGFALGLLTVLGMAR